LQLGCTSRNLPLSEVTPRPVFVRRPVFWPLHLSRIPVTGCTLHSNVCILHFCRIDGGKKCARKHKFLKFISQIYFFPGMTPLTGPSLRQVATPHALTACNTAVSAVCGGKCPSSAGTQTTLCLKNVPRLTCYNLYIHRSIATIFGKNVAEKV